MAANKESTYTALLGVSALFALAAILTLVPNEGASWKNVLGYKSLCTFSPIATSICALLAMATCIIRARLFGPMAGVRRSIIPPLTVGILLLAVITFSVPAYMDAKAEAVTAATTKMK